jgi:hypothetical protein
VTVGFGKDQAYAYEGLASNTVGWVFGLGTLVPLLVNIVVRCDPLRYVGLASCAGLVLFGAARVSRRDPEEDPFPILGYGFVIAAGAGTPVLFSRSIFDWGLRNSYEPVLWALGVYGVGLVAWTVWAVDACRGQRGAAFVFATVQFFELVSSWALTSMFVTRAWL